MHTAGTGITQFGSLPSHSPGSREDSETCCPIHGACARHTRHAHHAHQAQEGTLQSCSSAPPVDAPLNGRAALRAQLAGGRASHMLKGDLDPGGRFAVAPGAKGRRPFSKTPHEGSTVLSSSSSPAAGQPHSAPWMLLPLSPPRAPPRPAGPRDGGLRVDGQAGSRGTRAIGRRHPPAESRAAQESLSNAVMGRWFASQSPGSSIKMIHEIGDKPCPTAGAWRQVSLWALPLLRPRLPSALGLGGAPRGHSLPPLQDLGPSQRPSRPQ